MTHRPALDRLCRTAPFLLALAGCAEPALSSADLETVLTDAGPPAADEGPPPAAVDACAPDTDLRSLVSLDEVQPSDTDPDIRDERENDLGGLPHLYTEPVGQPLGKLLLFIPGTDPGYLGGNQTPGGPQAYTDFLKQAAGMGYHVLGLVYVNETPIHVICRDAPDSCQALARIETITGQPVSPDVMVSPADSIVNRVRAALEHLGWTQFLDDATGQPRWDLIAVAGHSQGGGHSAMMGRLFSMDRVILTASTESSGWTVRTPDFETPAGRYFGLTSLKDIWRPHLRSWRNLEVPGAPASINSGTRPANGSQRLTTTLDARDLNHHGTVVLDSSVPFNDFGMPLFRDAWCYVLGD